ncbi:MAG: aminoglycoside phosphotransferase family protein [Deltaproteobacteria bacterium]|nr:aminoglycoside phosphotransferase family protein [Deltaproteobacteria bacterium]
MDIEAKVAAYLDQHVTPGARLLETKPLGEGVHGTAYRVRFMTPRGEKRLIMKTLFPSRFGHDHFADRAQVLLLANANYNDMPHHIHAVDVVGDTPEGFIPLGKASEFYIFMEEAPGVPYFKTLDRILERGDLQTSDGERTEMLARLAADIHSVRYTEPDAPILYKRRIRDLIGHGECIMGIIDAYDQVEFATDDELVAYAASCLPWWGKLRNRYERLCRVHGDYHPGNIRVNGDDFTLLDRSRGSWGEAADDAACLSINYLHYALKKTSRFEGPFEELFRLFFEVYLRRTEDRDIFSVIQPFFAFRTLVVANPRFYPDDTRETKQKLLRFGRAVLREPVFRIDEMHTYLED